MIIVRKSIFLDLNGMISYVFEDKVLLLITKKNSKKLIKDLK